MLSYPIDAVIHCPVSKTVVLFKKRSSFSQWQPGLIRDEEGKNKAGQKTHKMTYSLGRGNFILTETILEDRLPHVFIATYQSKGVINKVSYSFTALDGNTTQLRGTSEFHFKGLMKLIGIFMRKSFEHQTGLFIQYFKNFAEEQCRKNAPTE